YRSGPAQSISDFLIMNGGAEHLLNSRSLKISPSRSPHTEAQWLAASASGLADVEANPLAERKVTPEIDGGGDAPHIAFPCGRTGCTAAARRLPAPKGTANLRA